MEFEEACSEMDYILEHMYPVDKLKIPKNIIQFFKDNKSITYKVKLDVNINLVDQELKDETKVFIQLLNAKFFAENLEKKEYNYNLFDIEKDIKQPMEIAVIKNENKMLAWVKKILKKMFTK